MPRREPTRVDYLAEAIDHFSKAADALAEIDLRGIRGNLPVYVQDCRDIAAEGVEMATDALRMVAPTVTPVVAKAS